MGDSQRLSPEEQLRFAREQYESARDLTVAVEEEFAILDPETLDLTNRFEELQAAAQGTALEEHLVGELIASEVEVRTGRCDTFEQVAACIVRDRTAPPLTILAVRRFCSARLAPYKIPRIVVCLDAIPMTARGKVDRQALDEAVKAAIAGFPEQLC